MESAPATMKSIPATMPRRFAGSDVTVSYNPTSRTMMPVSVEIFVLQKNERMKPTTGGRRKRKGVALPLASVATVAHTAVQRTPGIDSTKAITPRIIGAAVLGFTMITCCLLVSFICLFLAAMLQNRKRWAENNTSSDASDEACRSACYDTPKEAKLH